MTSTERAVGRLLAPKTAHVKVRGFDVVVDKPESAGGTDQGPMASEYLLAALASCTLTTASRIAHIRKVDLGDLEVTTEMDFDDRGEVTAIRLHERVRSTAPREAVEKVLELAERACTISKLLAMRPERTVKHETV